MGFLIGLILGAALTSLFFIMSHRMMKEKLVIAAKAKQEIDGIKALIEEIIAKAKEDLPKEESQGIITSPGQQREKP